MRGQGSRMHGGSKTGKGMGSRAGYDDPRYKAACARLRTIGTHICMWCRNPIDMQLKSPHPLAWSADHITPRSQLTVDDPRHWHITNLQEMHRRCNSSRGDRPMASRPPLTTSIQW